MTLYWLGILLLLGIAALVIANSRRSLQQRSGPWAPPRNRLIVGVRAAKRNPEEFESTLAAEEERYEGWLAAWKAQGHCGEPTGECTALGEKLCVLPPGHEGLHHGRRH